MEKYKYIKNDCFLMRDSDINEPMTVYQITDIDEKHIWAKSLCIANNMIHGLPISEEYDKTIPDDAIPLPSNSWQWARNQMSSFVKETSAYLRDNVINKTTDIKIGGHYIDSRNNLTTIKGIGEERIKYKLFKIDEDFISPYWTGDVRKDNSDIWHAISDKTYNESLRRYKELLSRIRIQFCNQTTILH